MAELLTGPEANAHLMRRAGFGHSPASHAAWSGLPYEELVERLLGALSEAPPEDPLGFDVYEPGAIQQLWLERMVAGAAPLAEKLAFFWHGHFATSNVKVRDPALMWQQYRLLRRMAGGRFRELLLGVSRDVAMIRWLDGNSNRKGQANENYARELQELFSLGRGNYTETDIREIARAFTGWGSRHHSFRFRPEFHDEGTKTIHGQTGSFDGADVVDILVALPACHRFIAGQLLRFFSHPDPTEEEIDGLATTFRDNGGDLTATLRALFLAPAFRDRARWRCLVKSPVELAVSSLRAAGFSTVPTWVHGALDAMGQILFRPPSVKGWPSGATWLSSAGVVERLRVASRLAGQTPMAAVAQLETVALDGQVPALLREALEGLSSRERVGLLLGSPEFQLC